ncbi:MAG: glycosyltransferase [Lachnospiraceae bacterium]|nr:glycosyltransferase [Lachnospiraceae bacterium]
MKKILFVINTMGTAGAEKALIELLKKTDRTKYELTLYVLTNQGELISLVPENVKLLNENIDTTSVLEKKGRANLTKTCVKSLFDKCQFITKFPYMFRALTGMIKKGRIMPDKLLWRVLSDSAYKDDAVYDLAVAYIEGGSTYYVADHVKAAKKAAFVHVDYEKAGYTRQLDKDCYLKYDRIFTVSDEVRESFLKVYPEYSDNTIVFHNMIDPVGIREKALEGKGFDDGYDGVRILSVGRLTAQKSFEISVDAMEILKKSGIKARWYVLGEGDRRPYLESYIKKKGLENDFILAGIKDNPYPYMKQADIYVHCSSFEGKSIAVQEAGILGRPRLLSDCSGNREQITDGVDGILTDLDPESISEKIKMIINDDSLRERISLNAAANNYDGGTPEQLYDLIKDTEVLNE